MDVVQNARKRKRNLDGFQPSSSLRMKLLKLVGFNLKQTGIAVATPTNGTTGTTEHLIETPRNGTTKSAASISRLRLMTSAQRNALRTEAIKYKHSADGSKSNPLEMHILYLKAGVKFFEHAVASGSSTDTSPARELLDLCTFLSVCHSNAKACNTQDLSHILVLYLKLKSMAHHRRFNINAHKINKIRQSVSRKRNGKSIAPELVQSFEYLVDTLKDPTYAVLGMEESEDIRKRVIAKGGPGAKYMKHVPQLPEYAAPESEELNLQAIMDVLDKFKSM